MLAATPPRLAALADGLAPEALRARPAPEEWSATEVLAHLRACADVWGGCIATILAEDRPTLRAVNPRTWIERTDYPELAFGPSLRAFTAQRAGLLAALESLPPAGKPLERTVLSYARRLARHERPHVKQIERIVNVMRP